MKHTILIISLVLVSASCFAQAPRKLLREGNRNYQKGHFDNAEVAYHKALEVDSLDHVGQYNLANALYRQEKYDEAARHYAMSLLTPNLDNKQRANALHNQGNSLLKSAMANGQQQGLQQAINAYQEALKLDPKNDDTRYNLAYARRLLQQQQQQNQQQQQQNQDNKDNKDNQQQQNQQQQQNPQQDQQQDQQQKPEPRDQKDMRKQDADRMLEAMKNIEKQTLREKNKNEQPPRKRHSNNKDW